MKKFTTVVICMALLVALLAMSVLVVGVRKAHAQTERPLSLLDCTGGCGALADWSFSSANYAGIDTLYVPNYVGSNTHDLIHGIIVESFANNWLVEVGYCFGSASIPTPWYQYQGISCRDGGEYWATECNIISQSCTTNNIAAIPAADLGHTAEFGAMWFSLLDYEVILDHENGPTQECPFSRTVETCSFAVASDSSDHVLLDNFILLDFTTEVNQGAYAQTVNKYQTTKGGAFSYESTNPLISGNNGTQEYTKVAPGGTGNLGGEIDGANEAAGDTANNCYCQDIDSIN